MGKEDEARYHVGKLNGNERGGRVWNDGTYSRVRKITVTTSDRRLTSLKFQYGLKGVSKVLTGSTHGGFNGQREEYILKPNEYITKISGYYGNHNGSVIIKSLTFETNDKIFGPFGKKEGTYFETVKNDRKIVGFFGRADQSSVYAIGVYKYG